MCWLPQPRTFYPVPLLYGDGGDDAGGDVSVAGVESDSCPTTDSGRLRQGRQSDVHEDG